MATTPSTATSGIIATQRCAVIGVGRMGRHHARVYSLMEGAELMGVVDVNAEAAASVTAQWGGRVFAGVDDLLDAGVDAVSIATPTIFHRAVAERILARGVACLIEKPLAANVEEAQAIVRAAARSGAVLQVGHIVRYDPVMVAVRALLEAGDLRPQFVEMDRVSPMTFRSVDVGVVLDMMIHDLDLLLMLMGSEPTEIHANAVSVLGEAEDVCNARLTFASDGGCGPRVANLTASRLALKTERKLRLICDSAYVSVDFVSRSGTVVRKTANRAQLDEIRQRLARGEDLSGVNYLDLVRVEPLQVGDAEPLRLQLDDFLGAVRHGRRPAVDAEAGFAAVRTAQRIVDAARAAGSGMV
jgi:predicted dehydrogenase